MIDSSGFFIVLVLLFISIVLYRFISDKLLVKKLKKIEVGKKYNNVKAFGEGVHYNVIVTDINVVQRYVRFKLDESVNIEDFKTFHEFNKDVVYHFQAKDFIDKFIG